MLGKVRFSRIGLKLADTHAKGYRWQHEAAIALAKPDAANRVELTFEEAEAWYRGRDIYPTGALPEEEIWSPVSNNPLGLPRR